MFYCELNAMLFLLLFCFIYCLCVCPNHKITLHFTPTVIVIVFRHIWSTVLRIQQELGLHYLVSTKDLVMVALSQESKLSPFAS